MSEKNGEPISKKRALEIAEMGETEPEFTAPLAALANHVVGGKVKYLGGTAYELQANGSTTYWISWDLMRYLADVMHYG